MILKGMLKWAVGKDDRPINPTKSLKKRRKAAQVDVHEDAQVGLISGCCKHRNNIQGPSRCLHKNRHRVGVINNNHAVFNKDPDKSKPRLHNNNSSNFHNYNNETQETHFSTSGSTTNKDNSQLSNSDSKSLLYMSLDHLPMAIVKQYERMLQDTPEKVLQTASKSLLKVQVVSKTSNNNNNSSNCPPSIKTKSQRLRLHPHKKSHSKSITFRDDVNENKTTKQKQGTSSLRKVFDVKSSTSKLKLTTSQISIKEAHNRPLKVLSPKIENSTNLPSSPVNEPTSTSHSPQGQQQKTDEEDENSNFIESCNVSDKEKAVSEALPKHNPQSPLLPTKKYSQIPISDLLLPSKTSTTATVPANKRSQKSQPQSKAEESEKENKSQDETMRQPSQGETHCAQGREESSSDCLKPSQAKARMGTPTVRINSSDSNCNNNGKESREAHDTTDPEFLEKPITYSTPPVAKCAKKLTLKRSELKKLERLKSQTERLNRFLKKYYHDCLPNLPEEEEDQCSPEEKSVRLSILRTHWREVRAGVEDEDASAAAAAVLLPGHKSNISAALHVSKENNKFCPLLSSSFDYHNAPLDSDESVRWENLRNVSPALISYANDPTPSLLPIIQEDSAESSTNSTEYQQMMCCNSREKEVARDKVLMDDSFLMSRSKINADESIVLVTSDGFRFGSISQEMSGNFKSEACMDGCPENMDEEAGLGMKKLKGLIEPLGDPLFDPPASLAEDEGFMSPYPPEVYSPASSTSTFNRFSVSSSGKGSTGEEHENLEQNLDEDDGEISNLHSHTSCAPSEVTSEGGGLEYIIMDLKHENANYPPQSGQTEVASHNETWNSHAYLTNSPCGTLSHHSRSSSAVGSPESEDEESLQMRNKHENDSMCNNTLVLPFSTPKSKGKKTRGVGAGNCYGKKWTPRKLVRKTPTSARYSDKGEILIRIYRNDGEYVTVHVVRARRLQPHLISWKLLLKISVLTDSESSFVRSSESIQVGKNRSSVKINQKFSFEYPCFSSTDPKVFLTFIKRIGRKTFVLGWITLPVGKKASSQCWVKLRKGRMSSGTQYTNKGSGNGNYMSSLMASSGVDRSSGGSCKERLSILDSPSPQLTQEAESTSSSRCDCEIEHKSQLQNSSTMDSGVEDCCEPPPPPQPSIELDEKLGQRVTLKMDKEPGAGFGFSVVWVSPPRIERLEKGKVADVAGLRIGDLIIGVNGEDVTTVPNTTIYTKMKTTGNALELEVWRNFATSRKPPQSVQPAPVSTTTSSKSSSIATAIETASLMVPSVAEARQNSSREPSKSQCAAYLPQPVKNSSISSTNNNTTTTNINNNINNVSSNVSKTQSQPPPISILKPPPPAPPVANINVSQRTQPPSGQQNQTQQSSAGSSWKIRFNIELLDNEDDCLKQFFICELKFFRKVVAALDRYLIPAQSGRLLTPQEINLMFSHVIKIITVTKRILNCVANGAMSQGWSFSKVLLSTHSDHLSEMITAYTEYAKTLGYSAMILSDKMSLQDFARFVLEITVPKGHLDMTSLLFAPLEHLRNICEICEEISHNNDEWSELFNKLKDCYADIVCETDFMEPISHVSMKKHPLLSVRDLEKRVVSTSCQPVKVCEKGRRWLFGSRLYRKEADGSWSPVWAFLFSDIIVLTSHTTRDRVFFVKEPAIRLEDVVTLHFNLPKKHENEFRLLFEPEPIHHSRLDKLLPLHRHKKSSQIALRTPNIQLKSMWKLLLQKQIITLNTRLSKSASSNFSISEFCERFPITPQCEDEKEETGRKVAAATLKSQRMPTTSSTSTPTTIFDRQAGSDNINSLGVIQEEKSYSQTIRSQRQYAPDGLSSMSKDLLKSRITRHSTDHKVKVDATNDEIKVTTKPINEPDNSQKPQNVNLMARNAVNPSSVEKSSSQSQQPQSIAKSVTTSSTPITAGKELDSANRNEGQDAQRTTAPRGKAVVNNKLQEPLLNNNSEYRDLNYMSGDEKCPCKSTNEKTKSSLPASSGKGTGNEKGDNSSSTLTSKDSTPSRGVDKSISSVLVEKTSDALAKERQESTPTPTKSVEQNHVAFPATPHKLSQSSSGSTASPSLSNNRVEMLKLESAGLVKQKPGPKIITNATLKSRQQEFLSNNNKPTTCQTVVTMVDKPVPDPNATKGTDCILISQRIEAGKEESLSPLLIPPRCRSENGFHKPKTIHTDSPLLTGYGSEKSRRRVLFDYKVRKDYPELFGITPKDRRSFIKRLAENPSENDRSLIAPYYFSPLPTPKFAKKIGDTSDSNHSSPLLSQEARHTSNGLLSRSTTNDNKEVVRPCKDDTKGSSQKTDTYLTNSNGNEELNLQEIARAILRQESEDDTDDDSDESECHEEATTQPHRRRSPEESSNDSGISDELTEKVKTKANERFQSNVAVSSSEVNFSAKISDKMQCLPKKAHACNSTPHKNTKIDHDYFEGEEEAGVEAMVVLKADKSIGTDDEYFQSLLPEKSMRAIMAERREAFFANLDPSSRSTGQVPPKSLFEQDSRLIVKIFDGGTLQSTLVDPKASKSPPSERVQLTRFPEKECTPRVERVESSDDSTSSDIASASPAAENGTTDPSWSSSSSSLAGYTSSKEEMSSSQVYTAANNGSGYYNGPHTNYSHPSGESSGSSNSRKCFSSSRSRYLFNGYPNALHNEHQSGFFRDSLSFSNDGPEIVITQESPETPTVYNGCSTSEGEDENSVLCNDKKDIHSSDSEAPSSSKSFLRVESNDSTVENYGDDDDYNLDDEDDLSQCSVATMNRYGTYESLEKIESEDNISSLPDFSRPMTRSKARFTFDDEDSDDDNDLFEEDFESDFNFRFPSQIQDNTYSVSRLGPLPPLLEEDYEDESCDDQRTPGPAGSSVPGSSGNTLRSRHEAGLRHDNSFLLARLATMYARSSISPLKILRELWLKKRYRQNWAFRE